MQIHELTKRNKPVDEGILDGLKAAVNVAKTGADSFASHMIPGYDTAKAGIKAIKTGYRQGGFKGAAAASVSGSALSQAQADLDQSKLANDPRIVRGKTFDQVLANVKQDPNIKKSIQGLLPAYEKQFFNPEAQHEPSSELAKAADANSQANQQLAKDSSGAAYAGKTLSAAEKSQDPMTPPGKMPAGTKTNKSQELARLQNKQMSAASGIKEARGAQAVANMKARRVANTPATTASGAKTADGIGDEIDLWMAKKIKGFNANVLTKYPEVETKLDGLRNELVNATLESDPSAVAKALENFMIVAKAGTMYATQKALEKKQKPKARAGDFTDDDGDGVPNDDEVEDDSAPQQSSPASRQLAINNLKAQGVDPATITKLRKLKQQGNKDVDAALNETKNQLYKELKTFKK
jgi:hypothetical protein